MINCLIVDDEPAAREVLQNYISGLPELQIAGICNDALEARQILKDCEIDLVFLDVNMPVLSGIEFLRSIKDPPHVILTTAYSEYAIESYDLNVLDYLLKPFSFERFLKAVDKVKMSETAQDSEEFVSVKADGKIYRIRLEDIYFAESVGDYITIHTKDRKITCYQTLKDFCGQLPEHQFSRVHKSFVVALAKIDYLEGNVIKMNEHDLPVGKAYKEGFLLKYLR